MFIYCISTKRNNSIKIKTNQKKEKKKNKRDLCYFGLFLLHIIDHLLYIILIESKSLPIFRLSFVFLNGKNI